MKVIFYGIILMLMFALVPVLFLPSPAQGIFDRDGCIRSCDWLKPRTGMGGYQTWANCIRDCEKAFWDEFDENQKDLERERDDGSEDE